jgi:hypothetical protein
MTTSIKTCFKCEKIKEINEFYRHAQMSDGRLNKCKECTKSDSTAHRDKNLEKIRAYDRARGNRQGYGYVLEYRTKNPKKYKAHTMISNALRAGKIKKPDSCQECDSSFAIEGHHDDYSKPLEVRWLCASCHKQWHAKNGEAANAA